MFEPWRILAIIGPILATAGALLLAYDVLRNPARAQRRKLYQQRGEHWRSVFTRISATLARSSDPNTQAVSQDLQRQGEEAATNYEASLRQFEESEIHVSFK